MNGGIDYVMIKVSEGESYVDFMFVVNWVGCKNNGVLCGVYYYFLFIDSFFN